MDKPATFAVILFYSIILTLGSLSFGFTITFADPAVSSFRNTYYWDFSLTIESLFKAIQCLTAIVGAMISPTILKMVGRRGTTFIIALFNSLSWLGLLFSNSKHFWYSIVMRAFTGISLGAFSSVIPMYIVELAPRDRSAFFGTLNQVGIATGIVICQLLGTAFEWQALIGAAILISALLSCLVWLVPESPAVAETNEKKNGDTVFQKKYVKKLAIGCALMIIQQFSGVNGILVNLGLLFEGIGNLATYAGAIATSAQIVAALGSGLVIDRLGRRNIWNVSTAGLFVTILFFILAKQFSWPSGFLIFDIFLYFIFFGGGLGPIPWFIVPELFEVTVRSQACSIATVANWIFAFLISYLHGILVDAIQIEWTMGIYAVFCLAGFIFGIFVMPNDKSPAQDKNIIYRPLDDQ